jgi:hypothetical protein
MLIALTTIVLYVLACDPLPPCAGKARDWIRGTPRERTASAWTRPYARARHIDLPIQHSGRVAMASGAVWQVSRTRRSGRGRAVSDRPSTHPARRLAVFNDMATQIMKTGYAVQVLSMIAALAAPPCR